MSSALVESIRRVGSLLRLVCRTALRAARRRQLRPWSRAMARIGRRTFEETARAIVHSSTLLDGLDQPAMAALAAETADLARRHPASSGVLDISVLVIPAAETTSTTLERCLASIQAQGFPPREILVARSATIGADRDSMLARAAGADARLRLVETAAAPFQALDDLVREAIGTHLLVADADGWLRPDLLFRFHQSLQLDPDPRAVLTCAGWHLDANGSVDGDADLSSAARPDPLLPLATDNLCSAVLLPRDAVLDHRPSPDTDPVLDLSLKAIEDRPRLRWIPVPLCARPRGRAATRRTALRRFAERCDRGWRVDEDGAIRPTRHGRDVTVQVVVPFRDQHDLTLACVDAVLRQAWAAVTVTAIDNRSTDSRTTRALVERGVDTVRDDASFNFSRLANRGAAASDSRLVLFLNNDVQLGDGALETLAAWALADGVGLCGCALWYPDGRLQHGGLELDPIGPRNVVPWRLVDRGLPRDVCQKSRRARLVDAVTAACAMVRREAFDAVGGFDELAYPNAFSDTDFATRLGAAGWRCVYTPQAEGIHVESASRPPARLEDFEASTWLREHPRR